MLDLKAKMLIQFWLGLHPRPRWVSLQRSPRPPSWIKEGIHLRMGGGKSGKSGGKGRRWKTGMEGNGGRGKELKGIGPSSYC